MKKLLVLISVVLVACSPPPVAEVEEQDFQVLVEETADFEIEEAEEAATSQKMLKELLKVTNSRMRVVEIEALHQRMAERFDAALDRSIPIEDQEDIVAAIVGETVEIWRQEQVQAVLSDLDITLNPLDLDWLIHETSLEDMYHLMVSYEMVYLKNNLD